MFPCKKILHRANTCFSAHAVSQLCRHTYMAHAVAFAAIRTTKTLEHFAESSYTTQLRVQTLHNTRIVLCRHTTGETFRKSYAMYINNNDILLRTHGPYHRHKSTKSVQLYISAHYRYGVST